MKLLDGWRRRLTRGAMVAALRVGGAFGVGPARSVGIALGRCAHLVPWLRQRLTDNLNAAGVDASESTVKAYFRRLGIWAGHSIGVHAAGFDGSLADTQIDLDPETLPHLDEAVKRGKGVIVATPHLFCYEFGASLIRRRYPVTALVRESKNDAWGELKDRWYHQSLGIKTAFRPRNGSMVRDLGAVLGVLRRGELLGITPDVLTSRGSGVPVAMFGRTVPLYPGMILLAMRTGAPIVTASGRWFTDPRAPGRERARVVFSEPLELPRRGDREVAVRDGLQKWCSVFETDLRRSPADWLFWLDKAWTKVFQQPATRATTHSLAITHPQTNGRAA
jgi:lauroyl/myristoyl acyltransferase